MAQFRLLLVNLGVRTRAHPFLSPPLGVMSLAAYVRERLKVDVRIVNQRLENLSLPELVQKAVEYEANAIGISSNTMFAHFLPELTRMYREALPDSTIILGGPHASAVRDLALDQSAVDAVVCGEGEWLLEQVLEAVIAGSDFSGIPGLIWRDKQGEAHANPGVPVQIEELDSLPMPAYDLIDLPAYWKHSSNIRIEHHKYAPLYSSRGCSTHCSWCHSIFGKRFRAHSAQRIIDEMTLLRRKYGIDDFEFFDDNFVTDRKRIMEFSQLATRQLPGLKLNFPNGLRGDIISEDMLDALVDAGLFHCSFSLESGSPRIQEMTGKRLNIPRFLETCRRAAARGVYVHGFCMMGFPTETEAELQQTIDVACQSAWHSAGFHTVVPFPGTELYDNVRQSNPEKLRGISYDNMDYSTIRVNLTDLPDSVLFGYQRRANRSFYVNPKRLYRLIRVHPRPYLLPAYVPMFLFRITKGLLGA